MRARTGSAALRSNRPPNREAAHKTGGRLRPQPSSAQPASRPSASLKVALGRIAALVLPMLGR